MDGGIYFLRDDLLIEKAFTTPAFSKRSIILNKTPSNYTKTSSPVHLVSGGSGNYVYMLRENNILIFETDTRNIRDVRSLKYVGQIEVSDRTIRSFIVPKDGEITLLTNDGIFSLKFEISDGKVNVR